MEYTVHEWKKTLRKNRVQIFICILLGVFVGAVVGISYTSSGAKETNSPINPDTAANTEQDPQFIEIQTETISNFTILATYKRNAGPFFT